MMIGKGGDGVGLCAFFSPVAPGWDFVAAMVWFKWVCFESDVKAYYSAHPKKNKWHIEGSGREEGSVLIWYNLLPARQLASRVHLLTPFQAWVLHHKGLNLLINVH